MLSINKVRKIVNVPICDEHIDFLRYYLDNKEPHIFLNAVGAFKVSLDKNQSYRAGQVMSSRIVNKYKHQIEKYLKGLKNIDY